MPAVQIAVHLPNPALGCSALHQIAVASDEIPAEVLQRLESLSVDGRVDKGQKISQIIIPLFFYDF